jgi:predicted dehydrogenase
MASIAHIGYGYWGKNLARNFAELGILEAVVDLNPSAAHAAAVAHKVRTASFEDVLTDPRIDGISIASPAEMHFVQAKAALEAGKHVYVEKPMTLAVAEAEELCALAQRLDLRLMVGHLLQYHPAFVKLRELVQTGDLGRLHYVYSSRLALGKFRREENVLWSFGPHDISMILSLFGTEPHHVTAQGNVSHLPGIADMVTLQMHFPGGGSGHVKTSWMHPFKEQRLVVIGEKAMATFEDTEPAWDQKLKLYHHKFDTADRVPSPLKANALAVAVAPLEPLLVECRHFAECIDVGITPLTDGFEGLRVLRVLDQAECALRENLRHQDSVKAKGQYA